MIPRLLLAALLCASLATLGRAAAESAGAQRSPQRSGAELYHQACATCHGVDGRGAPGAQVGFDTPLPDFTDCSFSTREPDDDWFAITHAGGPVRAFDEMMPAFGDALREDDIERVLATFVAFVRSALAAGRSQSAARCSRKRSSRRLVVDAVALEDLTDRGQARLRKRWRAESIRLIVPWRQQNDDWGEASGDIGFGMSGCCSTASGQAASSAPARAVRSSGDEQDGFGSGHFLFGRSWCSAIIAVVGFFQLHAGAEPLAEGRAKRASRGWHSARA
jgi:mono/diheme cytochrome c family protein